MNDKLNNLPNPDDEAIARKLAEIAEKTQASGKYVILVAPGNRSDVNRETFAFASYLLISNGRAAFRYSTDDQYREVWYYDNYKINLGTARGSRYKVGTAWRRDFTNGYLNRGRIVYRYTCSTCHNPHGTSEPNTNRGSEGYPDLRHRRINPSGSTYLCVACH